MRKLYFLLFFGIGINASSQNCDSLIVKTDAKDNMTMYKTFFDYKTDDSLSFSAINAVKYSDHIKLMIGKTWGEFESNLISQDDSIIITFNDSSTFRTTHSGIADFNYAFVIITDVQNSELKNHLMSKTVLNVSVLDYVGDELIGLNLKNEQGVIFKDCIYCIYN